LRGFWVYFFTSPLRKYRIIAWLYLTAFAILIINGTSKGEYLAPAYASLFAAAGVFAEKKLTSKQVVWIKYAYPILILVTAIFLLPMILPVLSVDKYIAYSKKLGMCPVPMKGKSFRIFLSFMPTCLVGKRRPKMLQPCLQYAYRKDEKKKCAIFQPTMVGAEPLIFLGEQYGLPKSIGIHNNYWIWGPRDYTGEVMIILGGTYWKNMLMILSQ
jgi:hypothetical protein